MSNLARKFGLIGFAVGAAAVLIWWLVQVSNPFHLPIVGHAPPNYKEPLLSRVIDDTIFVLCPGTFLQVFTLEMSGWFSWLMWILAVLLNGPIYYAIGLLVGVLLKSESAVGTKPQGV